MRVSVCVGNYAKIPYRIEELDVAVYSMEELCFCLKENAFLLDISLMRDSLVNWIGKECGLTDLSHALHPLIHRQGSLSNFVLMILEYVGLYEGTVLDNVAQILKKGAGLSSIERRKSQVDLLLERKKYGAAIKGYDHLLAKWQEDERSGRKLPGGATRAGILHNKGVALAGMMRYEKAAACFTEAYAAEPTETYLKALLTAKRLELNDRDYLEFAAAYPESYRISLELEKQLEECREMWPEQPESRRLQECRNYRKEHDNLRYCEECDQITGIMRSQYRFHISD